MAQELTVVVTRSTGMKVLEGATSLFAMTVPSAGMDAETRQGIAAADAANAVRMYEWFDRVGFAVDRAALRREFPDVTFHDFESWTKTQDWSALHV